MDNLKTLIKSKLAQVINEIYGIDIKDDELFLETPPKKELGDYAFPCFGLSKLLKKGPAQIGQEIIDFVNKNKDRFDVFSSLEIAGPYLNLKINKLEIISLINDYNINKFTENHRDDTIIVDYIGANVGKPLHIGHMCTPNQGQAMINVYKRLGFNVISDSHIGDWGIIFGKLILAYKMWGDEEKLKENAVEHLFELYVKVTTESESNNSLEDDFRKQFKLLSEGNTESIELWRKFTRYSIDAMNILLGKLNIKPDYNIGESFYEGLGLPKMENYPDLNYSMKMIVEELVTKGIATKNEDNSVGVVFPEYTKLPSCVLQKRDGTHGYLASDLACVKYRVENWNPWNIIYFVDVRQQLHLKQVFEIANMAGWIDKKKLIHAYNGFISLKDGAMSTRKGRIIKLDTLLDEAESRAKKIILEKRQDFTEEELNEISKVVGIGAIKYGYLKKSRETDVIFDWDEFMTFEGNSGPYIQYAYVRAKRILEKSQDFEYKQILENYEEVKDKVKEESLNLIKLLVSYTTKDGILVETAEKNMPHILANYCYELTKAFNAFYNNVEVLGEENIKIKKLALSLTNHFAETIKQAFDILGIDMPEKM
ncbi:MAG: arginine--tRNA ligase [Candidatus Gracilibacteria bacterium]|nr:arginine--tRNA ligase [Candidatus Gracilibacteria bacterium]